jgi:PleD family two-component response regulator
MLNQAGGTGHVRKAQATQRVVVVNGSREMLELLESVLDAGHYDMVFVADTEHAYSQIKQHRPQLVVLSLEIDDPLAYQVLSMLKLDPETSHVPVLTYTNEFEGPATDREPDDEPEDELPLVHPELAMN